MLTITRLADGEIFAGRPAIQGGIFVLVIRGGILLLVLGGVEKLNVNRTASSIALVVALLPWFICFDKNLDMYLANFIKFFLAVMFLFLPFMIFERYANNMKILSVGIFIIIRLIYFITPQIVISYKNRGITKKLKSMLQ